MSKRTIRPFRPVYPSPAALITSADANGRPNIITLGETFNISIGMAGPVIVGIAIAKARYSHELISASREYVVNFPTAAIVDKVDHCGTHSGRDIDKFAEFALTPMSATQVTPPLIAECPINIECRVLDVQEIGDHDLFLGEVVVEHADEAVLDSDGHVLVERLDALVYQQGQYWTCGERLGSHGFTRRHDH